MLGSYAIEGFEAVLRAGVSGAGWEGGEERRKGTFSSRFSRKLFPRMKTCGCQFDFEGYWGAIGVPLCRCEVVQGLGHEMLSSSKFLRLSVSAQTTPPRDNLR